MRLKLYSYLIVIFYLVGLQPLVATGQDPHHMDLSGLVVTPGELLAEVGVDTTQLDSVKSVLLGANDSVSGSAALFLAERNGRQLIPLIADRFNKVQAYDAGSVKFLKALEQLEYSGVAALADPFADSLYRKIRNGTYFIGGSSTYLEAVRLLFAHGDYAHMENLRTLVRQQAGAANADKSYIYALTDLVGDPALQGKPAELLVYVLRNYRDPEARLAAVSHLDEVLDPAALEPLLRNIAVEDPSPEVRWSAITTLRHDLRESDVIQLAVRNLSKPVSSERVRAYITLIALTNTPEGLYELKRLMEEHPDAEVRRLAGQHYRHYWAMYFQPFAENFNNPTAPFVLSPSQVIDSLRVYTEDVASYDWLGDRGFVKELTNRLQTAARHLARGDSAGAAKQISNYQQRLRQVAGQPPQDRSPRFVTDDGYRYLSRNARYLLGRLPDHSSENKNKRQP